MSVLSLVQAHPEIGNDNAAYVSNLVDKAKNYIKKFCHLPSFPELSQGYAKSASGASTNISGISTNEFWIAANGSTFFNVEIDLSNCDSGDNIATEFQSKIRAISDDNHGFDEIVVGFDATSEQYTVTSGRYGEYSIINFDFVEDKKHVCQSLRLTPEYGGTEVTGNSNNDTLIELAADLVIMKYNQIGLEGMKSGSVPGGISFTAHDIPPDMMHILTSFRRLR